MSPDKWGVSPDLAEDEVPAQLLTATAELRAPKNALSFYESPMSPEDAVLRTALAYGATCDQLDPVHVAWIDRTTLEEDGIPLLPTEGQTPVRDLKGAHRDAGRLDAFRLARIANRLAAAIRGNDMQTVTREHLKELLQEAINAGRVGYTELKAGLRKELLPPAAG